MSDVPQFTADHVAYLDQKIPEFRAWLQLGTDLAKRQLAVGVPPETIVGLTVEAMLTSPRFQSDPGSIPFALAVALVDMAQTEMAGD